MFICISGAVTNKCQIKEGIVFANHNWNDKESQSLSGSNDAIEGTQRKRQVSAYENYTKEQLKKPEYQHIRIGIERLYRTQVLVEKGWQFTSRNQSFGELDNMLTRLHELEKDAEKINDFILRGFVFEQLDAVAATRRNLSEEIRWDVEANKVSQGIK